MALLIPGTGAILATGSLFLAFAPRLCRRFRTGLFRRASRAALALLRLELRVLGTPPEPPFLLVTNHLSYLDVVVLASLVPGLFVAKAEVRRWPLLGPICRGFGTIFIDREDRRDLSRVLGEIEKALEYGEGVVFFPEGTSSPGDKVGPFRSPLLAVAARKALPVHYAALGYQTPEDAPPARLSVCWWGDMGFLPHLVSLFRLPRIEASLAFGPEPVVDTDRKRLAERLREGVERRSV